MEDELIVRLISGTVVPTAYAVPLACTPAGLYCRSAQDREAYHKRTNVPGTSSRFGVCLGSKLLRFQQVWLVDQDAGKGDTPTVPRSQSNFLKVREAHTP